MENKILNSFGVFIMVPANVNTAANNSLSYLTGAIIALFIMGYLVYTLLKPEKF